MTTKPGYERLLRGAVAVAIVLGPLGYLVGGLFAPAIHEPGHATILANANASSVTNAVHLVAFFIASFLLPIGVVGLAYLAYGRTPWLATVGGMLGVLGWLPFSALTALEDLAVVMAHTGGTSFASLLDDFSNDAVMNGFLITYIVCHLVAYVLLGIALHRARAIPAWAAWLMIASSPLTIAAFAFHDAARSAVGVVALALLFVGSIPAAWSLVATGASARMPHPPAPTTSL